MESSEDPAWKSNSGHRDYNTYTIMPVSIPIIIIFYLETVNCNTEALNNTLVEARMALEVVSIITKMENSFIVDILSRYHDLGGKECA